MREDTRTKKDVAYKIRQLMFNIDLNVAYINSEIKIRDAIIESFDGVTRKDIRKKYINAKIEKERYEIYLKRVIEEKEVLLHNVSLVLERYNPLYREIFEMVFLARKPLDSVADHTGYSLSHIKHIVAELRDDLIKFYDVG